MNTHKPRVGDLVYYKGKPAGRVTSVDDSLCWCDYSHAGMEPGPFIWRFKDGLNVMHDWPTKPGGKLGACPGTINAAWTVYR